MNDEHRPSKEQLNTARASIPARLDGDMLACLLRTFPDCEIDVTAVIFTFEGTEFRTQTMDGAVALVRELVKRRQACSAIS